MILRAALAGAMIASLMALFFWWQWQAAKDREASTAAALKACEVKEEVLSDDRDVDTEAGGAAAGDLPDRWVQP